MAQLARRSFVGAIMLAAAVVAGVDHMGSPSVPWVGGDCRDRPGILPEPSFDVERSARSLTVIYRRGITFTQSNTVALLLVLRDTDRGRTRRFNWRQAAAEYDSKVPDTYPVSPGDAVTIDHRRLGIEPAAIDVVTIRWRRRMSPPTACPADALGATNETVALETVRPNDQR